MTVLVFGCADLPLIHYLSGMRGTPQKDREQCLLFSPVPLSSPRLYFGGETGAGTQA